MNEEPVKPFEDTYHGAIICAVFIVIFALVTMYGCVDEEPDYRFPLTIQK